MSKCKTCNNKSRWCSNNWWCNKFINLLTTLWACRILTFNSNKWCSLKCLTKLKTGKQAKSKTKFRCNNQTFSTLCHSNKCHRISKFRINHRIYFKAKCHNLLAFKVNRTWCNLQKFIINYPKAVFYPHSRWNCRKQVISQLKLKVIKSQKSTIGGCTQRKMKL